MQYEIQLSVGLTNIDNCHIPIEEAIETINAVLAEQGQDGYSIVAGTGYWKGLSEYCLLVSWVDDSADSTGRYDGCGEIVAGRLATLLRQECVLIVVRPVGYRFVSPIE